MADRKKSTSPKELERAKALDKRVRDKLVTIERTWLSLANDCREMRDTKGHKHLGFPVFGDWLREAIGRGKSVIYKGMQAIDRLGDDLTAEDLDAMTLENASVLATVPKAKRYGLVEKAKTLNAKEFRKTVNQTTGGAPIEERKLLEFWPEESLWLLWRKAVETVEVLAKKTELSNEEALETILADYVVRHQNPEAERAMIEAEESTQRAAERFQ
jgi:hypothetical protein